MKVKRFFIKLILLIFPVYIIWVIYIETMPMFYNTPNNTRWLFIKESLSEKDKIPLTNILFLGESRVNAAIDFTQFKNSYSFASGGATPIEMYYILTKYLKNNKTPDTLFYSISPRFLTEIFGFYDYAIRNNLFTYNDITEINKNYKNHPQDTVLGNYFMLKYLAYSANYIEYYQSDVNHNHVIGAYKKNLKFIEENKQLNGGRPHPGLKDSCSSLNYETKYIDFTPSPLLTFYLEETFHLCRKNNIHIIFEFMPMNKSSYNKLTPKFITSYKLYIQNLAIQFPNHQISDSVYFYNDSFFGDASHLNSKGKKKYTKYLKTLIGNNSNVN